MYLATQEVRGFCTGSEDSCILTPYGNRTSTGSLFRVVRETYRYLDVWKNLIMSKRPSVAFTDVVSETVRTVMDNFNGDMGKLETYVKHTALQVPVHDRRVQASLDQMVSEDSSSLGIPLVSLVDETANFYKHDNAFTVGRRVDSKHAQGEVPVWYNWLSELKGKDLSAVDLSSDDVFLLVKLSPILSQVLSRQVEEAQLLMGGSIAGTTYKKWWNTLEISITNQFKFNRSYVREQLPLWVSLFLQNQEVLTRQFALWCNSDAFFAKPNQVLPVVEYKDPVSSVRASDNTLVVRSQTYYNLFELDFSSLLDTVYDDWFESAVSNLSFELNGVTYYNVLGGIFSTGGDLTKQVQNAVVEYIIQTYGCRLVLVENDKAYFEFRQGKEDILGLWFYYGMALSYHLVFKGKKAYIG